MEIRNVFIFASPARCDGTMRTAFNPTEYENPLP
jgi:hypothetical protein